VSRGHPLQGPKPWTATVLERGSWEIRLVSNDRLPTDGSQLRLVQSHRMCHTSKCEMCEGLTCGGYCQCKAEHMCGGCEASCLLLPADDE
jgi:hypothetical protein